MYVQKSWFASRKFWLAVVASGVAFANAAFDLGFEVEQVGAVVLPIVAYIFGQSFVDTQTVKVEQETFNIVKRAEASIYTQTAEKELYAGQNDVTQVAFTPEIVE
jgi:hypothetical protein